MKQLISITLFAILLWHCQSAPKVQATTAKPEVIAMARQTHKEAMDTLLADSTAATKALILKPLDKTAAQAVLAGLNITPLIVKEWPDNGFYGSDNYRIEFIFTGADRSINDPSVYSIKGKNRFKKTVSDFAGLLEIKDVTEFTDPNLDTADINSMGLLKMYAVTGTFRFHEDSTLNTSGLFSGNFKVDFALNKAGEVETWYFSNNSPTKGGGYIFEGNWASYKNSASTKPFIFARDFFVIANGILSEFSYGEREVEINPKYRHLGWDNFWDGEEWWTTPVAQQ